MVGLAKAKSSTLSKQREASQKEIEDLESLQGRKLPRPYYVDEPFAEVSGIAALYPENNLRDLVILGMEEEAKVFRTKDIDSMSSRDLARWKKWVFSLDSTFDAAAAAVAHGVALLKQKNLAPLNELDDIGKADRIAFADFLAALGS
jgi:hypothetical protein